MNQIRVKRVIRAKNLDELMSKIYGYELKRIVWMEVSRKTKELTVGVR